MDFPTGYKHAPACFLNALLCPVPSKNAKCKNTWRFLAGVLGLEPRAYGFGDDAVKNGIRKGVFEVYFSRENNQKQPF